MNQSNRFYPWLWNGLLLLAAFVPYLIAYHFSPAGQTFMGSLINPDDHSVYLAAMRQGGEGNWLFHFNFSPEPIPPRLTYPLYLLLGRLTTAVHGDHGLWFHIFRLLSGIILLQTILMCTRTTLSQPRQQQTALFLALFGGGFGWLLAPILQINLRKLPDIGISEWGVLQPLLGSPHFIVGLAAEIGLLVALLRLRQTAQRRWAGVIAGCSLAVGLIYPYLVSVVALIGILYLLLVGWQQAAIRWRLWLWGGIGLLPLLPLFAYYAVWARQDPNWEQTHVLNNIIPTPTPWLVLSGLGLVGIFGLVGLWSWLATGQDPLLPLWALVKVLVLYLPLPFAGRFLLGLTIPWVLLAAFGLETAVLPRLAQLRLQTIRQPPTTDLSATPRRLLLILTTPSTLLLWLILLYAPLVNPQFPLYLPNADVTAVRWLASQLDETDLVLAHYPVGNTLPRYTNGRVFLGQPFLTLHLAEKLSELTAFWNAQPADRQAIIARWGISYIYVGTIEKQQFDATILPLGTLIYDQDGVQIYRLTGNTR